MTRRPSLRAAIDAMCKSCIYDPGNGNGTWREQVEACLSSNCPLHPLRPISAPKTRAERVGASGLARRPNSRLHGPKNGLPSRTIRQLEGNAA